MSNLKKSFVAIVCALVVQGEATLEAQTQSAATINLRNALGLLQSLASMLPRMSREDWESAVRKEGLRPDSDGTMWRLRNGDGELRAQRSSDGRAYHLLFFPATDAPVPSPMLDWMLRESRYVHLDDGDKFLIGLPPRPLNASGERGELQAEVSVYLPGGSVSRTAVTITWAPSPP